MKHDSMLGKHTALCDGTPITIQSITYYTPTIIGFKVYNEITEQVLRCWRDDIAE